jgi:AcrR family transcriptional regulator
MSEDTKTRLLEAAEKILILEGVHALTIRHVGTVSGLNSTLITYHFGGISGLLAELCRRNLEPIIAEWQPLGVAGAHEDTLGGVLGAWLGPLIRPAAFTPGGRALVVLDEIAAHGDDALSAELLTAMLAISDRVRAGLGPFLPHLSPEELRARVRFISAAALGPPPRARVGSPRSRSEPIDSQRFLVAFAESALLGPAAPAAPAKRSTRKNQGSAG